MRIDRIRFAAALAREDMVAMSIWGDPSFGKLLRTLNATVNYIVNTATFFCSVPVAYDELQITGAWYSNIEAIIMMLTEGLNRGRMKYDESKQALPWNCCFLFSGEGPVVKPGSGGGVFNRVIEVECRGPVVPDGNAAATFVRQNHGHAGKTYIEYIKSQDIPALYRAQQAEILEQVNTTGKQASSMALMMIADKLAGECLFPGEQPLTVETVRRYLKTERDVDVSERAYSYICGVIAANVTKFISKDPDMPSRPASSEIWGSLNGGVCTFNKVKLEERLKEGGFDFDAVKKKWADKGYLERTTQQRFIHKDSYGGVKAYSVRLAAVRSITSASLSATALIPSFSVTLSPPFAASLA